MKMYHVFLGIGSIMLILVLIVLLIAFLGIYIPTERVESKMIASGWAAFSELDLDILAEREEILSEEDRNIYLKKDSAEEKTREYIKKNLKLDSNYYATEDSFINLEDPVVIENIRIYNPDELPETAPNGKDIKRTSIYIKLKFPLKIHFFGERNYYRDCEVIVDTESFYSNKQKERI